MRSFVLYISTKCPYCNDALELLSEKKQYYVTYDITDSETQINEAKTKYRWETLPIIIGVGADGDKHFIGGFSDLQQYFENSGVNRNGRNTP